MTVVKSKKIQGELISLSILNGALHLLDTARGVLVPMEVLEAMTLKDFVNEVTEGQQESSRITIFPSAANNISIVPVPKKEQKLSKEYAKLCDTLYFIEALKKDPSLKEECLEFLKESQKDPTFRTYLSPKELALSPEELAKNPKAIDILYPPVEINNIKSRKKELEQILLISPKEIDDETNPYLTKLNDYNMDYSTPQENINMEETPVNLTNESIVPPNMEEINKLRAVISDATQKLDKLQDQLDELNQILQFALDNGKEPERQIKM